LIGNRELALAYIDLVRRLGVHVSSSKTHFSTTFCEFAKRILIKGRGEVSPFPVSALKSSSGRYYQMVALLLEQELRD